MKKHLLYFIAEFLFFGCFLVAKAELNDGIDTGDRFFLKSSGKLILVNSNEEMGNEEGFFVEVFGEREKATQICDSIKNRIDIKSWRKVSEELFCDKGFVYVLIVKSDEIYLKATNIRPQNLCFSINGKWIPFEEVLEIEKNPVMRWYFADLKNVYYRGRILKNCSRERFKIMGKVKGFTTPQLAFDGSKFYDAGEVTTRELLLEQVQYMEDNKSPKTVELRRKLSAFIASCKKIE